ncbi:MAG: hypothetical protein JWP97_6437 [Labilithrix sp.]|nr:hypothetical protein [Labilithrix sp.]
MTVLRCFGIGFVAGLRSMTAPAAVALSAPSRGKARYLVAAMALGELVVDKLPGTPSRKAPLLFAGRIMTGALSGAVLGARSGAAVTGLVAGAAGAIAGTLAGADLRSRLADTVGADLPAALLEDVLAIGAASLLVSRPRPRP